MKEIKTFGRISSYIFRLKKCPLNISPNRKYQVSGDKNNILTKTGNDCNRMGTICENYLEKDIVYNWKIKILQSQKLDIQIGIAPFDFDIHSSDFKYGWYLSCDDGKLYSGQSMSRISNLKKISKDDEIIVVMNMKIGALKFLINNEDKGYSYTDIPLDKPLVPAILLFNKGDSVEIDRI